MSISWKAPYYHQLQTISFNSSVCFAFDDCCVSVWFVVWWSEDDEKDSCLLLVVALKEFCSKTSTIKTTTLWILCVYTIAVLIVIVYYVDSRAHRACSPDNQDITMHLKERMGGFLLWVSHLCGLGTVSGSILRILKSGY